MQTSRPYAVLSSQIAAARIPPALLPLPGPAFPCGSTCPTAVQSIVYDLRQSDLVTNAEEANLKFNAVHFLRRHGMKPHVLPVCFFAGKIQRALDEGSVDSMSGSVLQQAFHLFLALLAEVGLLEPEALPRLKRLALVNQPQNYYHNSVRGPPPARVCPCCPPQPVAASRHSR